MDPVIFNSMLLVTFALFIIPRALKAEKIWIVVLVGIFLFPFEVFVTYKLEVHAFPLNVLAGIFNASLAMGGGYLYYYFELKRKK